MLTCLAISNFPVFKIKKKMKREELLCYWIMSSKITTNEVKTGAILTKSSLGNKKYSFRRHINRYHPANDDTGKQTIEKMSF